MIIEIQGKSKTIDVVFVKLDFNLYDKSKSNLRIFLTMENVEKLSSNINIDTINRLKYYDEDRTFEYLLSIRPSRIGVRPDTKILTQYCTDIQLYEVVLTGELNNECIKSHTDSIIDIVPTFKCNMNCDYCGQRHIHDDDLSDCENLREVYKEIHEQLVGMKFKQVNLIGGELSIDMNSCELANDVANSYFMSDITNRKKVFTNCKKFNIEFADFIKNEPLTNLCISISSLNEKVYDPRHADTPLLMANIKKYVDYLGESKIKAVIVLNRDTLDYVEDTVSKLRAAGVHRFIIKLENHLNDDLFNNNDDNLLNKFKESIIKLSSDTQNMLYIRNDITPSMYICFLLNRSDNEGRNICEMVLCTDKTNNSPIHIGVEDLVFTKPLRLFSVINNDNINWK